MPDFVLHVESIEWLSEHNVAASTGITSVCCFCAFVEMISFKGASLLQWLFATFKCGAFDDITEFSADRHSPDNSHGTSPAFNWSSSLIISLVGNVILLQLPAVVLSRKFNWSSCKIVDGFANPLEWILYHCSCHHLCMTVRFQWLYCLHYLHSILWKYLSWLVRP